MTIKELEEMKKAGQFHHATHRPQQFDTLFIYRRSDDPIRSFRGYELAGGFSNRSDPDGFQRANEILRGTGISVGAYGNG